ncbi:MAG TPA: methyl-accepting chemotaxis protein [Dictyobacter sp.]|nr:methyl-accepting chemotaxis protein [Dictyobacter sp.]
MSERKILTRSIPLKVRIRTTNASSSDEAAQSSTIQFRTTMQKQSMIADLSQISETEQHARQVKELLRLCDILRAGLSLDEILQQIVESIVSCTGFRGLGVNLIDEKSDLVIPTAFANVPEEDQRTLHDSPFLIEEMYKMLREEFRISQSYFIPHDRQLVSSPIPFYAARKQEAPLAPGEWHTEDMLLIPFYSPREQKLLGFLSLDEPINGKVPTREDIEIVELFATQVSIAIDNANLFQEKDNERLALENGIADLREDLRRLQQGDLRVRVRSTLPQLEPVAEAVNTMVERLSTLFRDMQEVTQVVDDHVRSVQRNSEQLVQDTLHQKGQMQQIAQSLAHFTRMMDSIAERAASLSQTAVEAVEVNTETQGTVDRAVEGMGGVRDAILHSARTMKSLSESGQEINETVSAISDLTMRMHLLALNAAIEATRAGEQGKGFAIIAQEIRSLAANSSEAAQKVSIYIRTIQQETTAMSRSVEQSTQQVIMQAELVTQTGVALDAVSALTEQLINLIQGICTSAESQAQGSQLVTNSVEETLRMTVNTVNHMQNMQKSTVHLVDLTNSLRSRMEQMQIREV